MSFKQARTSSYQPCDTFFVESYDAPLWNIKQQYEAADRAKHIARERQAYIAEELSNIVSQEYKDDVLSHMEQMDVRRPFFFSKSFC